MWLVELSGPHAPLVELTDAERALLIRALERFNSPPWARPKVQVGVRKKINAFTGPVSRLLGGAAAKPRVRWTVRAVLVAAAVPALVVLLSLPAGAVPHGPIARAASSAAVGGCPGWSHHGLLYTEVAGNLSTMQKHTKLDRCRSTRAA